jgi:hypothetical protein
MIGRTTLMWHPFLSGGRYQSTISLYQAGQRDAAGVTAPSGQAYLWISAQEVTTGLSVISAQALNYQLVGSDGATYSPVAGGLPLPPSGAGRAFGTTFLESGDVVTGWLEFVIPQHDGVYTLRWAPVTPGDFHDFQQFGVDLDTPIVTPLWALPPCAVGSVAVGGPPRPTPTVSPPIAATIVTVPPGGYYPPGGTYPTVVVPTPYPGSGGGGYCIRQEHDGDNDDNGKPAASWDHDGCP